MSVVTKMYLEGKEYNVLNMKFEFDQPTDVTNKPKSITNGGLVNLTVETTMGTEFLHWVHSPDMKKNLILEISPSTKTSKSRIIELYDVYCYGLTEHFTSQTPQPMLTHLKLSAGIFKQGSVIHEKWWKTSTPTSHNENTAVASAPAEEKEKKKDGKCRIEFEADNKDREDGIFGFDYMFNHFKNSCTSGYAKLKEHYTPIDVDNEEYFVPWLSMRQGQTITLKLNKKPKKLDDFERVAFDEHPDFTISPADLKEATEIQITCNNANPQTTQLTLKADNKPAGALNIFYPPPKKVKVRWVFVEVKGGIKNPDKNVLKNKISEQKLIDIFDTAFNPALIDVEITNNSADILDLTTIDKNDATAVNYSNQIKNCFANNSTFKITDNKTNKVNFLNSLYRLYTHINAKNNRQAGFNTVYLFLTNLECVTVKGEMESSNNGISFTGSGISLMFLKNDKSNPKTEIPHEIMHALALQHTFSESPEEDLKNPHTFKQGRTDNYMDYNNSKKHTFKWQWEQLRNSKFTTE